jgi:hypothetical protein
VLRAARRLVGPLLLYGAVVCWLTWPLAASVRTQLPVTRFAGRFDPLYTAWVLAWETHALGSANETLLRANIYYPTQNALLYGPPAFGALPYFAAVFGPTGNPALALNFLFLGSAVLAASFVHIVTREWTDTATAGLVAGCTLMASRWIFWDFAVTAPQFAVVFYLPLIVDRAARPLLGRRGMLTLFLLVLAQGLADLVYLAPATMLPLLVIAGARLARDRTRAEGLRLLAVVGLAGLVLVAVHWPWLALTREVPDLTRQTPWPRAGYTPVDLPWGLLGWFSPVAVPTVALAVIALGTVKALVRRWRGTPAAHDRLWKHAALWAIVGTAISLPSRVRWRGTILVLPHVALAQSNLPFPSFIRMPQRLGVSGLVGLALFAGVAFAELASGAATAAHLVPARLLRGAFAMALVLCTYLQYARGIGEPAAYGSPLPHAYPLRAAVRGDSTVLRVLRTTGGPTLELPFNLSPLTYAEHQAVAMYRSIFHWQPLLNGYASYWPRDFPELMTLAARLPDPQALQALRSRTGLRFVLVRLAHDVPDDADQEAARTLWRRIAARRDRPDLELVAADDELMLFRVTDRPVAAP